MSNILSVASEIIERFCLQKITLGFSKSVGCHCFCWSLNLRHWIHLVLVYRIRYCNWRLIRWISAQSKSNRNKWFQKWNCWTRTVPKDVECHKENEIIIICAEWVIYSPIWMFHCCLEKCVNWIHWREKCVFVLQRPSFYWNQNICTHFVSSVAALWRRDTITKDF